MKNLEARKEASKRMKEGQIVYKGHVIKPGNVYAYIVYKIGFYGSLYPVCASDSIDQAKKKINYYTSI